VSGARLVVRQIRFTNKAFWRNHAAAFFTIVFPLMFLVIFSVVFRGTVRVARTLAVPTSNFYVPAIATFSVITACYTNLAMSVTFQRDQGILKRLRGTPLPAWAYLTGRVAHAVLIAVLLVAICVAFGAVFYDAGIPTRTLPAFLLTLAVGAGAFSALGLAATAAVPNADAASPIVNASILPLMFFSNVFIPLENPPTWVDVLGKIFPVRHFADAMQASFFSLHGNEVPWTDLLVVAAWGLGGLLLAVRYFSWEPRG